MPSTGIRSLVMSGSLKSTSGLHPAWPLVAIPIVHVSIGYFELSNVEVILIFTTGILSFLLWARMTKKGIFAINEEE